MFKPRDVVSYRSAVSWCRHGIAVIYGGEGWAYAKDTYWGVSMYAYSDSGWLREEDLVDAELIGNLDDFEPGNKEAFGDFRDEDKFYIPIGGSSESYWYCKGAFPDPALTWRRMVYQVEKAESEIQSANWKREWAVKELNEHISKHGIPDNGQEKECDS